MFFFVTFIQNSSIYKKPLLVQKMIKHTLKEFFHLKFLSRMTRWLVRYRKGRETAVLILLQPRSVEAASSRLHFVMPAAYVRIAFNECTFPKRAAEEPRAATCCNRAAESNAGVSWFIKRVATAAPSGLGSVSSVGHGDQDSQCRAIRLRVKVFCVVLSIYFRSCTVVSASNR